MIEALRELTVSPQSLHCFLSSKGALTSGTDVLLQYSPIRNAQSRRCLHDLWPSVLIGAFVRPLVTLRSSANRRDAAVSWIAFLDLISLVM